MEEQVFDQDFIEGFLNCRTYAVLGVSPNKEKYGYKVFTDLKEGGYNVFPVNSRYEDIYGDKCYPDLKSLPEKPDVVDFVCPPGATEQFVRQMVEMGIDRAWMQPGAESREAIQYCLEHDIEVLHDICVMVERRRKSEG